jgi:hypothetical protein
MSFDRPSKSLNTLPRAIRVRPPSDCEAATASLKDSASSGGVASMPEEFLNQSRSDPRDDPTADPTRAPTFSDVRKIYTVMVINGRADGLPILEGGATHWE